jgi:hypothetical protein
VTDSGGATAYSGTDFALDSAVLEVGSSPSFDYETTTFYTVYVKVADGSNTAYVEGFTISITDVNDESPVWTTSASQSVDEGTRNVATLGVTDGDAADSNTATYAITTNDNSLFEIDSGVLRFVASGGADFESPGCGSSSNTCTVIVLASDAASTANTASRTFTITIGDINDNTPSFTAGDTATPSVAEGETTVATYAATDADGTSAHNTVTYTNTGGADTALFAVASSTGALTFSTAPDYDSGSACAAGNSCVVILTATSGSLTDTITVTVAITDINDNTPVFTAGSLAAPNVAEGQTTVATYAATDADGSSAHNTVTYTNTGGADTALFAVASSTGALTLNSP